MNQRIFVLPLDDPSAAEPLVGWKGAGLARLAAAGLPVPGGFHVTAEAYQEFVERAGLREQIMSLASQVDPDLPATAEAAAGRIAELFERHHQPMEVSAAVRWAYAGLGDQDNAVAVRSSVRTPSGYPPAGMYETVLNVRTEAALLTAIRRCWASLWSAKAIEYRARNGIDHGEAAMAVLVQSVVPADAGGVMCTATGTPGRMRLNATFGLSGPVVSGRVTPDTLVVEKGTGHVLEQRIAEKRVMSIASEKPGVGGAFEEQVPVWWRGSPVLSEDQAAALAGLGERIEALYGHPMDVEWVLRGGNPYILEARPLTGLEGRGGTEVWNDSLSGDYLWTSAGLGEAVPDVMTPCTWSLVQLFMKETIPASAVPGLESARGYGNIGGRFYMNLSVASTFARVLGTRTRLAGKGLEQVFGRIPPEVEIPPLPISRAEVARSLLPVVARARLRGRSDRKRLPDFLASSPGRCEALRDRIRGETDLGALVRLWGNTLLPFFVEACRMLGAARHQRGPSLITLRRDLARTAGDADADAMLTGLGKPGGPAPAGLGPLTGLAELSRGDIDQGTYLREWGHRGPHEFEISTPRPDEIPEDLERFTAGARVVERLGAQRETSRAAWRRFRSRYPGKVTQTRRRIGHWAQAAHEREAARSEVMRVYAVIRAFVLRAGDLTGRRDDLFFLTIDEILAVLNGNTGPLDRVDVRRRTHESYRSLAPYPVLIRGRFDPVAWAGSRTRRTDLYDASEPLAGQGARPRAGEEHVVRGFPGVAGVVEGTVRVVDEPEQGGSLRPGEILVTSSANIGWAPLIPIAAAMITDVGAPLSQAAIVARELAVPAVVGCGNATTRLRTGDHVRVDAGSGTVRLLSPSGQSGEEPATVLGTPGSQERQPTTEM